MFDDPSSLASLLLRFAHIAFGVIWLGVLVFFSLVNAPLQTELDDATKAKVNPGLLLRALFWARRTSLYTVLAGWFLFGHKYMGQHLLVENGSITNRGLWILTGGFIGTLMWFNLAFIIYPRQRTLLLALAKGEPLPGAETLAATAAASSKLNLYLSGPLLFCMVVPNNYPGWPFFSLPVAIVVGVGFWFGLVKKAGKVKPLG